MPTKKTAGKKASPKKASAKKASAKKVAARKASAKKAPAKKASAPKTRTAAVRKAGGTPPGTMPAGGEAVVLAFIHDLPATQRAIVERLHRILMDAVPGLEADVKWSMPVYSRDGIVGYVAPFSKHVNLGFFRGSELDDAPPEGIGKGGRHIKIRSLDDIDAPRFTRWVKQAVALDKT